ncbi:MULTISPECIES: hypothetical protein [Corynebacterium]|uniref:Major facilitator superfamily (MFS) profile domain-containing protein n=2 Tax=Corynebacterium glucuronolyticum TaxID=39791 RepID=A0AAX1LAW3_9CORY|nr:MULTISPECIES: hypothetical protein [Corynebacterium]MCT1441944.1 hypothetical protein [Corynebacterium glucuronolyticum]OFO47791.1 hypothetical protein HMPREF3044_09335 [Corynebacterium sp. HMSC073D01]QQU89745.1 hypothetical protein I6I68_09605 [Corynebacterium glucuronolyticum]QRP71246.1 hypothetical protein I6J21_03595 [Corynebacterium glucuronolyticum]
MRCVNAPKDNAMPTTPEPSRTKGSGSATAAGRLNGRAGLPTTLAVACYIALVEGLVGVGYGIFLIVRELMGVEETSIVSESSSAGLVGIGTAIMFLIFFGGLITASVNLLRGGQWGRGLIVFINILLLGCAYYAFTAGKVIWIVLLAGASIASLVLSFHPRTLRWAQDNY